MIADQGAPAVDHGDYRGLEELSAVEVAARLSLRPHPEGGFFTETYRSSSTVRTTAGDRPLCTVILYLLTAHDPSHLHRLRFDEMWFYHAGSPAEMVLLSGPDGSSGGRGQGGPATIEVIGLDNPQLLVPGGWWMGARILTGEQADWGEGRAPERRWTPDRRANSGPYWTLVSCLVSPGFAYEDFELAERDALLRAYPLARAEILALA